MQVTKSPGFILDVASLSLRLRQLLLLVLSVIACIPLSEAASNDLDDDMTRLKRGEILFQIIHRDKPGGAARVTALLHTNPEVVWGIIGYCKYELAYVRGLDICEMLEGDQFQMTMRHRIKDSWYSPTLDYIFEATREAGGNGEAHLLGGDLKVMQGYWKLSPHTDSNGVIVVHEIRVQLEFPVPKWLIRRNLSNNLPDMMACIRGLAGASGADLRIAADLERCPGEIPVSSK